MLFSFERHKIFQAILFIVGWIDRSKSNKKKERKNINDTIVGFILRKKMPDHRLILVAVSIPKNERLQSKMSVFQHNNKIQKYRIFRPRIFRYKYGISILKSYTFTMYGKSNFLGKHNKRINFLSDLLQDT